MVPQSPSSPRLGKISNWSEFLEVLEDFETIVGNYWDSEETTAIPSRLSTLGLQLAAWMTEQTRHDPNPMLDVMRAVQAKDPLGCMTAFRVSVDEVDKLLWRWWPTKEMLIDAALAAGGEQAEASEVPAGERLSSERWILDSENRQLTLDGKPFKLSEKGCVMVDALIAANGDWVSGWAQKGISKPSDVKGNLPRQVRLKIETASGKGYRIKKTAAKKG